MRVATVRVTSKELCLELQESGFTIGSANTYAFGWKLEKELSENDLKKFAIKFV